MEPAFLLSTFFYIAPCFALLILSFKDQFRLPSLRRVVTGVLLFLAVLSLRPAFIFRSTGPHWPALFSDLRVLYLRYAFLRLLSVITLSTVFLSYPWSNLTPKA